MMAGMVTSAERRRVGLLIKKRRQELGIRSQAELAALVGTSKTSVTKWETGQYYPSRYLGKLEAVLRVSLTDPEPSDPREAEIRDLAARTSLTEAEAAEWIAVFRRRNPRELAS